MTQDDAELTKPYSVWHLLLQFVPPGGLDGRDRAVKRVAVALTELGLPPYDVGRIGNAVTGALPTATERDKHEHDAMPVLIRVWMWGAYLKGPSRSHCEAAQADRRQPSGWGFFMIQKQGADSGASVGEVRSLIDLFLYDESTRENIASDRLVSFPA